MTNTVSKDRQRLIDQVNHIVKTIENGISDKQAVEEYGIDIEGGDHADGYWYLLESLDIQFIVSGGKHSDQEVLGARILVAFGGPNIWINTQTKTVEGYWWGDAHIESYSNDAFDLDEAIETLYSC